MKKKWIHGDDRCIIDVPKILRIMKLTTIILFLAFMQISAANYAQNTKLTLSGRSLTLEEVFGKIEEQSEFSIFYNLQQVDLSKRVDVDFEEILIDKVLDSIFTNTDLTWSINNRLIVVHKKKESLHAGQIFQERVITGRVIDRSGLSLPGVSVFIKGSTVGTITDNNGTYSLGNVYNNATLVFSFVGMQTLEVPVGNQAVLNVILEEETFDIEEVVAVGYGTLRKNDLTGSVTQIKAEELVKMNSTSISEALQGRIPVEVGAAWKPGSTPRIEIRGINSITGSNDPLWVIDGIPMQSSNININPHDIESVNILKDASATAIYGSRGSNGVIIITTKTAQPGSTKIKVNYDGWVGLERVSRKPSLQGGLEYVEYKRLAAINAKLPSSDNDLFDQVEQTTLTSGNFTDWFDLVWGGQAFSTSHNVTLNVSGQKMGSKTSVGYLDQGSLIEDANYKRYNLSSHNIINVSEKLNITTSALASYSINNDYHAYVRHSFYASPLGTPYDSEGNLKLYPNPNEQLITNPLAEIRNNQNETKEYGFIGSVTIEWEFLKDLKYKFFTGIDLTFDDNGRYFGSETRDRNGAPFASRYYSATRLSSIMDNLVSFNKLIDNIHRINAVAAFNIETFMRKDVFLQGSDMDYDGLWYNLGAASTIMDKGTSLSEWGIMSTMGRVNYSVLDKYLLTVTYRYDGSSRLAEGNKWKGFPSASIAWRISQEEFIQNMEIINNMKLRLSWGNTGNTNVAPYETLGRLSKTLYDWNEKPALGYIPSGIPNPNLTWEKTEEYNLGLDIGLFNNKLSAELDLYNRTTKDLMLSRNLPMSSGFSSITQNIGSTRNKGIELSVVGNVLKRKEFSWTMTASFARNKNQILDLYGDKKDDIGSSRFIGQPIRVYYMLDYIGVWQENEVTEAASYGAKPGDPKFRDLSNPEGQQRINLSEDRIIVSREPKWIGGLNSSITYKSFELGLSFYTRQGVKVDSDIHKVRSNEGRQNGINIGYWTPEKPTNSAPAPLANGYTNLGNSNFYVYDVSFIRLSNINLAYTFSKSSLNVLGIEGLKAYINVKNPYVWTKYEGMDPQNGTHREDHPPMTSYQFGVNVSF